MTNRDLENGFGQEDERLRSRSRQRRDSAGVGLIQIQRFPDVPEPGQKAEVQAARQEPQDGRGRLSGAGMNRKGIRVRKREAVQQRETVQREKTRWREAVQRKPDGGKPCSS